MHVKIQYFCLAVKKKIIHSSWIKHASCLSVSGLFRKYCFERRQTSMHNKRQQADQIFRYLGLWMCAPVNCSFNLVILLKMSFFMYQICHAWIGLLGLRSLGQATSAVVSLHHRRLHSSFICLILQVHLFLRDLTIFKVTFFR